MLILSNTTDSIEVVLLSATTTNQLDCVSSCRDITNTSYEAVRVVTKTNNTTPVSIVSSPSSGKQRVVDFLSIYNSDTANAEVTIRLNDNGTSYTLWKGILQSSEKVEFNEGIGFKVFNNQGVEKKTFVNSSSPTSNSLNTTILGSDVVNNNATLNTIANVTGLSFNVVDGGTYWFRFAVLYTAQAGTTGSRWSISVPANSLLGYTSRYTLTATTNTLNNAITGDVPAASNATSLTGGNICILEGFIVATADGTVQLRFASEVANSAITAKTGSKVDYQRVV